MAKTRTTPKPSAAQHAEYLLGMAALQQGTHAPDGEHNDDELGDDCSIIGQEIEHADDVADEDVDGVEGCQDGALTGIGEGLQGEKNLSDKGGEDDHVDNIGDGADGAQHDNDEEEGEQNASDGEDAGDDSDSADGEQSDDSTNAAREPNDK